MGSDGILSNLDGQVAAGSAVGIWKSFGATHALKGVSLEVLAGETHGLVGRNGAGKSTLVAVLTGLLRADRGHVELSGKTAPHPTDRAAWQHLVACVYQRSMVVPSLSVAENIFLNRPTGQGGALVRWGAMRRQARQVMNDWGFDLDVERLAGSLSVEQRQVLEIARAVSIGARFLILDEPTASLEKVQIDRLFERIQRLRSNGLGILYISHHLEEIFSICDRVTVLRDGERVLQGPVSDLGQERLIEAMVGEAGGRSGKAIPKPVSDDAPIRLELSHVSTAASSGRAEDISFRVQAGECVGLVGLRGSGTTAIADAIVGFVRPTKGDISVDGVPLRHGRVDDAFRHGIGYIPEDRHARGLIPSLSVEENLTLVILPAISRWGIVSAAERKNIAAREVDALAVVASGLGQAVSGLSGGNQQKVVVGRSLAQHPAVLIAVAPTTGVDVASKEALLLALSRASQEGMSVLIVSDDMEDLTICSRLLIMSNGRLTHEFRSPPWDQHEIIRHVEGFESSHVTDGQ